MFDEGCCFLQSELKELWNIINRKQVIMERCDVKKIQGFQRQIIADQSLILLGWPWSNNSPCALIIYWPLSLTTFCQTLKEHEIKNRGKKTGKNYTKNYCNKYLTRISAYWFCRFVSYKVSYVSIFLTPQPRTCCCCFDYCCNCNCCR